MKKTEIIFSLYNERRHAQIVNELPDCVTRRPNSFIGKINGYSIYSTSVLIDNFSFVAIKEK